MKNFTLAFALVLLAALVLLLWRIESHLAPLAESARVQLADREAARRADEARRAAAERAEHDARVQAEAAAAREAAEAAAHAERALEEARRQNLQSSPVKPGEIVPAIILDNRETVRDAVVVAVQPTSVSFRVGAQLYNIPAERLPEELRARLARMFPAAATPAPETPARP